MRLDTIVVGHDFSKAGAIAVDHALTFARGVGAKCVHIVHVVEQAITTTPYPSGFTPMDAAAVATMQTDAALRKLEEVTSDDVDVTIEVRVGIPARELVSAAVAVDADVLVVAHHRRSLVGRAVYGSVTSDLIRTTPCLLLVAVEGHGGLRLQSVVAGVDLSSVAARVVEVAIRVTAKEGRTELVTAYEPPLTISADEQLLPHVPTAEEHAKFRRDREQAVEALIPSSETPHQVAVNALDKAPAGNAILEVAQLLDAGLVVVGIGGHNAWHRAFVGSTTRRVVSNAPCPVLLVPFPETSHGSVTAAD